MSKRCSSAWSHLRALVPGDPVPAELYVLDYQDGTRPRWTVHSAERLASGGRCLVLVDADNVDDDLFEGCTRAAVTVLTWPGKTMRTQPHPLGGTRGPSLCDMDQQGPRATRA